MCGGLVGDHVEPDAVAHEPRNDIRRVADQADRRGTRWVVEGGQGVPVVVGHQVDPSAGGASLGSPGIDLDRQHPPAVEADADALRAAHAAEPGGQHALPGQRAAEVAPWPPR